MASQLAIADRRQKLQELEAQGITSTSELARRLGVSERCVQIDLQSLDAAWEQTAKAIKFRDRLKRRLVARSERRYLELQAEWERSKTLKERETTEAKSGGEGKDKPSTKATRSKEGRLGDPAYVRAMREEDEHIATITGISTEDGGGRNMVVNINVETKHPEIVEVVAVGNGSQQNGAGLPEAARLP